MIPADGVVMDTPATCDLVTGTVLPIRCGVTREFGRRATVPFSSDLTVAFVNAESVDKGVELAEDWVRPLDE